MHLLNTGINDLERLTEKNYQPLKDARDEPLFISSKKSVQSGTKEYDLWTMKTLKGQVQDELMKEVGCQKGDDLVHVEYEEFIDPHGPINNPLAYFHSVIGRGYVVKEVENPNIAKLMKGEE